MKARLAHFDIPARDPARAGDFFRRALDWEVEPVEWNGPAYFKLCAGPSDLPAIQGGLFDAADAGFEHPLPVLHLSEGSIEDCLARVEAAGGTVSSPPHPVGEFGRFARFRDLEGHEWGVWTDNR